MTLRINLRVNSYEFMMVPVLLHLRSPVRGVLKRMPFQGGL